MRTGLQRKAVDETELLMREKIKKVKITTIGIQVGWEKSGSVLSNLRGSFVCST